MKVEMEKSLIDIMACFHLFILFVHRDSAATK